MTVHGSVRGMKWLEVIPGMWRTDYQTTTSILSNGALVSLGDGKLAVVSPPQGVDDAFFKATDELGKVVALVAPNSGHDLGQAAWQERYPDASTHAPEPTAKAIAKSKPKLRPFTTIASLQEKAPSSVKFIDLPGTSSGSVGVVVEGGGKRVLVVDDCISNSATLLGPIPFKVVFWVTGSGPGLSKNKIWWWAFCKDKKAYAKALLEAWDGGSLDIVLPLHGDEIRGDGIAAARAFVAAAS
jgi:hypothetical protein